MKSSPTERAPLAERVRRVGLFMGPALALLCWSLSSDLSDGQRVVAACTACMACWWMCESLPMWGTALIPFLVFPLAGVGGMGDVLSMAWNPLLLLFVGGMLLARALQNAELHRRIALHVLRIVGGTPRRLVLGVACAGAGLSMFVSNTATALLLFPIAGALIHRLEPEGPARQTLGAAVMLGLAYGCNMGGAACLIGTPPNLIFAAAYEQEYGASAPALGFLQWWMVGLPLLFLFLPLAWLYLTRIAFPLPATASGEAVVPDRELRELGAPSRAEWLVGLTFGAAALGWITRGSWKPLVGLSSGTLCDALVALTAAALLFLAPAMRTKAANEVPKRILTYRDLGRLPWGLLTLLAGGILLSRGFGSTDLTGVIAGVVKGAAGTPVLALVFGTSLGAVVLSALTSNTGTAGVLAPVLLASAPALGVDPRLLLMPAALGVSCDFALPVGTPPNAVAFGGGYFTIGRMMRVGIVMDILAVLLVTLVTFLCAVPALGIELGVLPEWAN